MSEGFKISTRGQGPELVLVHGWSMHSGIWGGLVDVLASEFRVSLVDLPGHGVNRHVPLSRDLDKVAELILSELPPAAWMGWSLGGLVTLAAALQQPHKVQKTVLVAATPCFSRQEDWDLGVSAAAQEAFADGLENDLEGTLDQFFVHCFGAAWVDESLRRLGKSLKTDDLPSKTTLRTGLHLLYGNNLLGGMETCRVPTLFLGGTRDRTINPQSIERAVAAMPAASARMIRAAGHAPFISHPEQFLDIILKYLKGEQTV